MNIRDFTYLINLAKTNHFGRAAEMSFVSQPTLSIQLKKLEETLGCQLIERRGKSAELTEAGHVAAQQAEQILNHIQDLKQQMQNFQDPLAGEWKLGIFPTLAPYLLPLITQPIRKQLPNLNVKLYEAITEECIQQLKNGQWDAILIADEIDDNMISSQKVFKETFHLALPKQHALAKQKSISAKKIPDNEILLLENGHCLREQSIEFCQRINKPFQQQFYGTSLETLISMVSLGEGITFIPELSINTFKRYPIAIRPLTPTPYRNIYLHWRKTSSRQACIEAFCTLLNQSVTQITL